LKSLGFVVFSFWLPAFVRRAAEVSRHHRCVQDSTLIAFYRNLIMERYIKTLNSIPVYSNHSENSQVIKTLPADEFITYNREKRREGINWLEIYLVGNEKGYVKYNKQDVFICKYAELIDDEAIGFDYTSTTIGNKKLSFTEIFEPVLINQGDDRETHFENKRARIEVKRVDGNKTKTITLKYDSNFVTVIPFSMQKKEMFYITYEDRRLNDVFIKVDNLVGKRGYLLHSTSYTESKDNWMSTIGTIAAIITVIAFILFFLSTGWLVMTGLYIIPAVIVGAIVIIILKIIFKILGTIFHQIRIRL
jgi:hypothetical protein